MSTLPDGLVDVVQAIVRAPVPPAVDDADLREWLATRRLGLIPIADPRSFAWPGSWIAVTTRDRAVRMYGVPSGPLDAAFADDESIVAGFIVAPHDLDTEVRNARGAGVIEAIVIARDRAGAAHLVSDAHARAGAGLEGDRYAAGDGTFSAPGRTGHDLTLVEVESLEVTGLAATDARRNIVTRGIDLDSLIGERFRIGSVVCLGQRRAEPCAHLERLVGSGTMRRLVHRGGLRADVLTDGPIRIGDVVERATV